MLGIIGEIGGELAIVVAIIVVVIGLGVLGLIVKCYRKVSQGEALIRNGVGGTRVSFSGMVVLPIFHRSEYMDISVKRIEIDRSGGEGLICRDNLRADIRVAFFVRVNNTVGDVMRVAQSLGCKRASERQSLVELFDAKFSDALKTGGKRFDFADLYTSRVEFKEDILGIIGTDLNGYVLEDAAIDYLEQTGVELMNPQNILDAEGIKKITEITSRERIKANFIERDKEKIITQQNVEAQEAILELNKQLAEAEQKQKREIATIVAREEAEAKRVQHTERLKAEQARIVTDEEVAVADENKDRQIIVARKNKERTEAVEIERVEKDRGLEATERERVVVLAQIEKDKAVEVEKREIQKVIRERVMVERDVVVEEEKIKDTREFAGAERKKRVAVTGAEEEGEQSKVLEVKTAEGAKLAAELKAEQVVIEAEAARKAAERDAEAKKMLADAATAEKAVDGMAEVRVKESRAAAIEKEGTAEANVISLKGTAQARVIDETGVAEAKIMEMKFASEAKGITDKAEAMKLFDAVGKEHEEFKLRLNKTKEVELAAIGVERDIAAEQARVLGEAVKSARIDIVGGDSDFFNRLVNSITRGKAVDRVFENSRVLTDLKNTFLDGTGDAEHTRQQIRKFASQFGMSSEDVKNLSVAAMLGKMIASSDEKTKGLLQQALDAVKSLGLGDEPAENLGLDAKARRGAK